MTPGVTSIPLPVFWSSSSSSSKDEGDQLWRRTPRKAHPCQNPHCAANYTAYTKEPPAKRIKRPVKNGKLKSLSLVSSNVITTESENLGGVKAKCSNAGRCADCKCSITTQPLRESSMSNSNKGSVGMNSKVSTTSILSSSYAPSISTPTRTPTKASKTGRAMLSVQNGTSSTRSSSPRGGLRGTTQTTATLGMATCPPPSDSKNRYDGDEHLSVTPPGIGRVAPPNSERDEEEDDQHPLTIPAFHGSPVAPTLTSPWPSDVGFARRPANLIPNNNSSTISKGPSSPTACIIKTMTPQASTHGCRATAMPSSTSSLSKAASEGHHASSFRHGTSINQSAKCRKTLSPRKRTSDMSTGSSGMATMATMGTAAQMSILEHRVDEEDQGSESSDLTTDSSDSRKESSSTELCRVCGANSISAFYNALYAPDCTFGGTKALDVDFHRHRRSKDRKLRVAIEIAVLSVLVSLLVVVFYPIFIRGLRSHFYGCCSCPPVSGTGAVASRNPSQHHSQLRSDDGWVYRGVRNLLKCPLAQQAMGSTVLK